MNIHGMGTAITQQTRDIHPMPFQCWASVEDGGPTVKRCWVNAACLLGITMLLFQCADGPEMSDSDV